MDQGTRSTLQNAHGHTGTDIHEQVSTATSSPSVPPAKQLSWSFPFKSSSGRTEAHCPIPCVTIQKLLSRTSHDRLLWMCVQTQAERKYLHGLTSYHSFSLFQFQQKKVMVVFLFPGSIYLTFKHQMAKQDLTEAFQRMQSHRHLDFVGFPPFCLQFLCHNILLTLLGPVTFQHHITAHRANSIRKRHKKRRIISLCSRKISLCGKAKRKNTELTPSQGDHSKHWQTNSRIKAENQRFPMSIHTPHSLWDLNKNLLWAFNKDSKMEEICGAL